MKQRKFKKAAARSVQYELQIIYMARLNRQTVTIIILFAVYLLR